MNRPILFSVGIFLLAIDLRGDENPSPPIQGSAQVQSAVGEGVVLQEFIYETAPFPECHASTLVETSDGTLVASWFGGTKEKDPDVGIWVSRHSTNRWSVPVEVANGVQSEGKRFPTWNPVLFQPTHGPLMLFFKVGPSPSDWWGEMILSHDQGIHWTERTKLPDGGIGPVKNKPVEMKDGAIWCPSSTENQGWQIHLEVTRDLGKSWQRIGPLNDGKGSGAIQPSLLTYADGAWQMVSRDQNSNGKIWQCWSHDQGKSWSELTPLPLPNPNSGIDAVTLKDGRQLMVYNHTVRKSPFPSGRQMLNVAISDDGKEWQAAVQLERDQGEYSYPAVIQTKDGMVHITYTWKRKKVRHVVLNPEQLKAVPMPSGNWPPL